MLVPAICLTLYVVPVVELDSLPVVTEQLPVLPVVQLTELPPTVKAPFTVAPLTALPELSFTDTVTSARQPLACLEPLPTRFAMETVLVVAG